MADTCEMLPISMPRNEVEQLYQFLDWRRSYWRDLFLHLVGRFPTPPAHLKTRLGKALYDSRVRNLL
jgi:hypothetical protein